MVPEDNLRIILCETTDRWTRLVRRGLVHEANRVIETGTLVGAWKMLQQHPFSLVALGASPDRFANTSRFLVELGGRFAHATAIVLGSRQTEAYDWVYCEAGARFVFSSTQQAPKCVAVIRRHLARAPVSQVTFHQSVWSRLPWAGR